MGYEREPGEEPANAGDIIGGLRGQQITGEKLKIALIAKIRLALTNAFMNESYASFPTAMP